MNNLGVRIITFRFNSSFQKFWHTRWQTQEILSILQYNTQYIRNDKLNLSCTILLVFGSYAIYWKPCTIYVYSVRNIGFRISTENMASSSQTYRLCFQYDPKISTKKTIVKHNTTIPNFRHLIQNCFIFSWKYIRIWYGKTLFKQKSDKWRAQKYDFTICCSWNIDKYNLQYTRCA